MMKNRNLIYLFVLLLALVYSCKEKDEYLSLKDKIEAKSKSYHDASVNLDSLMDDSDLIKVSEGGQTFFIPERKGQIKSFECIECHSKPLKELQISNGKKAHWDVKLNHASSETMNCATCHNGNDMNNLNSLTGSKIDFNMSYKQCAQCHSSQFEDWKGGAHGKKMSGWLPPRESMTCVNCHDPHDPSFKTRWPSTFNTQKGKQRKEGLEH